MEGIMLCCARPKPQTLTTLVASSPSVRRAVSSVVSFAESGSGSRSWECTRRQRHSSTCRLAASTPLPSIWHAITPSADGLLLPLLHRRQWPLVPADEGSWNAAWDVRPARWLHGSDSAWLLFGVCPCFSLSSAAPTDTSSFGGIARVPVAEDDGAGVVSDARPCYRITGMLADGRCLFRAISYGACLICRREIPNDVCQAELADDLRARVADKLLERRHEVERFIDGDFDSYVENIRQPHVWGGEPELLMASHVLQKPVSVFVLDDSMKELVNIANYGSEYGSNGGDDSIKVLFHGYGHYDALHETT